LVEAILQLPQTSGSSVKDDHLIQLWSGLAQPRNHRGNRRLLRVDIAEPFLVSARLDINSRTVGTPIDEPGQALGRKLEGSPCLPRMAISDE